MSLKYTKYRKNKLAIYGDRDKHEKALKNIGARWNSTLPDGPGWTVYDTREKRLQELIKQLEEDENVEKKIDTIKKNSKSRKNQKKYHRSVSQKDSDVSSDDNSDDNNDSQETPDSPLQNIEEISSQNFHKSPVHVKSPTKQHRNNMYEQVMKEEIRKRVKAELKRKERRKEKYKVDPRILEYYSKFAKKPSKKKKK